MIDDQCVRGSKIRGIVSVGGCIVETNMSSRI